MAWQLSPSSVGTKRRAKKKKTTGGPRVSAAAAAAAAALGLDFRFCLLSRAVWGVGWVPAVVDDFTVHPSVCASGSLSFSAPLPPPRLPSPSLHFPATYRQPSCSPRRRRRLRYCPCSLPPTAKLGGSGVSSLVLVREAPGGGQGAEGGSD